MKDRLINKLITLEHKDIKYNIIASLHEGKCPFQLELFLSSEASFYLICIDPIAFSFWNNPHHNI